MSNTLDKYQEKIGCFIQIPNIGRGQVKYVGTVDAKPGHYAGIDLLANIGKNDGSFNGRKYFDTEYPKSGLFIQLNKVANLIENATISRRNTLLPQNEQLSRNNSLGSVSKNQKSNVLVTRHSLTEQKSPTPVRTSRTSSNRNVQIVSNIDYRLQDHNDDLMDIDTPSSAPRSTNEIFQNINVIREYELKVEKQQRKIIEYERLLNDQRIVLEEIQPTIDACENNIREIEQERDQLKAQLDHEREQQKKQKQYFETEHEQLLEVVTQLHQEITENERRIAEEKKQQASAATSTTTNIELEALNQELDELRKYKDETEYAKKKWDKEKEQLRMHNESLSKEYQALNKELLSMSNSSNSDDKLKKEILQLKEDLNLAHNRIDELTKSTTNTGALQELQEENIPQSLPLYEPEKKIDAAAGRKLWCVLCEKSGHEQIDCPFQYGDNACSNDANSNEPLYF
ncbi:hypothetical protein KAFR_0D00430 [Kazachstania africana CBS 2517]|uniref:CAP-Gly domain-containing protein n=1 Tax=Kazachstania africana (strain ATCC 22294 / BCRC 22015 / CBS 2517 / CECT 1963 / NBRC 1671 / NRRL Y-8276) TaxID=1071382 RepID=H2ATJ0_KAZAF|nr:hypothetical protein KAFR_0D00430 [Kazachstania africana CBS 2517]CCF57690.1 hypothetical protein KAFR_0D00430 [Kazachstania africana CBS 2517]